jgi:PIN domain nuclease of toxin-antitoxin system
MKLLMDTHAVLWFFDDVEKLSQKAFDAILNPDNDKYVSIASVWELAIKISLGKMRFSGGTVKFLSAVGDNGFVLLPVKEEYVKRVEILPYIHRDPFDRMLIASAMSENMYLISADKNMQQYNVTSLW